MTGKIAVKHMTAQHNSPYESEGRMYMSVKAQRGCIVWVGGLSAEN